MSYGPTPWLQTHWDARAATNFMAGGCGAGLVLAAALARLSGAPMALWATAMVLGLVLVATGLTAVWFEIGRPLRAVNVLFNPRTSWMSREAMVAPLLFACAFAALATGSGLAAALLVPLALGFIFTQAMILRASKGIAAWSAPQVVGWIVATGAAEGFGLALALASILGPVPSGAAWLVALLGIARALLWSRYETDLRATLPPRAAPAIAQMRPWLLAVGAGAPVALVALATLAPPVAPVALAAAGIAAWAAGWRAKYLLVCRAAHNRGFSIPNVPVRGRR